MFRKNIRSLFEDKSRMYRKQAFKKAMRFAAEQILVSEDPKLTQRLANMGKRKKGKAGQAGLMFLGSTEAILRSREFWAGIAASSIAGIATSIVSTTVAQAIERRQAKKADSTVETPTEVYDEPTVPDEYEQYIA